ncbi:MAG: hypothetical protein NVSMB31_09440 [Vulcanimicrobiaceae bacterium]
MHRASSNANQNEMPPIPKWNAAEEGREGQRADSSDAPSASEDRTKLTTATATANHLEAAGLFLGKA